jgi:hypothetical protein
MANIHVLSGNGGIYRAVMHTQTPAGNNAVGVSWVNAIVNSGMNKTVMTEGAGAGQITTAEKNQILAGTVIEAVTVWQDDPTWTTQQRLDDFTLRTQQAVADRLAQLGDQLKYFGYTQ